jgi:hypothetical protein
MSRYISEITRSFVPQLPEPQLKSTEKHPDSMARRPAMESGCFSVDFVIDKINPFTCL